jgi:glycerol uptake facilitator-like aquaporin
VEIARPKEISMSKRTLLIAALVVAAGASLGYSTGFSSSPAVSARPAAALASAAMSPATRITEAFAALASVAPETK